jgi:hypothetical protein
VHRLKSGNPYQVRDLDDEGVDPIAQFTVSGSGLHAGDWAKRVARLQDS